MPLWDSGRSMAGPLVTGEVGWRELHGKSRTGCGGQGSGCSDQFAGWLAMEFIKKTVKAG